MTNPLLTIDAIPNFDAIKSEHFTAAIKKLIADCWQTIEQVLAADKQPSWDNTLQPILETENQLDRAWYTVMHLNAVRNTPDIRAAYETCLGLMTEFHNALGQHEPLFNAIQQIANSDEFTAYQQAQREAIQHELRDFKLAGIGLPKPKQSRYRTLSSELAELSNQFENNLIDATDAWHKQINNVEELAGLPEHALAMAQRLAAEKQLPGYVINLEAPSYLAVITYCQNRELREEVYQAFVTRASDQGPQANQFDNSDIMPELLAKRHELANLLGFNNYAEYSLATKMAENTNQVNDFLMNLAKKSQPIAAKDWQQLQQFAKQRDKLDCHPWDMAYYSELQKQDLYGLSDEKIRRYFTAETVISGLFTVVNKLFGVTIKPHGKSVPIWDPAVKFYDIYNSAGDCCAHFYFDLYARSQKRGGAWMAECQNRMHLASGDLQRPIAYLTCNLTPASDHMPALFSHDEVITLFHEFGHGIHHMLTTIDISPVSGINGVPWDAVEFPSQFLENWCWQSEALALISSHYETGEPIPTTLLEKMLAAKNYQAAMQLTKQLEFSLFDWQLHCHYDPKHPVPVQQVLDNIRQQVAIIQPPDYNRFQHSFSHIFGGEYAAGYYSYKWAEVLAADAFGRFEAEGIFNPDTGRDFYQHILSQGGSQDPMLLFKAFRGRAPNEEALLRQCGIE